MTDFQLKNTVCVRKCIAHQPLARFGVDVIFACSMFPTPLVSVVPYRHSLTCDRSSVSRIWSKGTFLPKHVRDRGNTLTQGVLCRASAPRGAAAVHRQVTLGCPLPMQRVLGVRAHQVSQDIWLEPIFFLLLALTSEEYLLWILLGCSGLCPRDKNRRRTRNPVLCFESSSMVAFPLQQAPKGDEMSICLCFPVIFWNGLHWNVHSSFISEFLFCYSMCSK